ncbi:MAG: hypothetical protein QM289_05575 [Bacillota bacterium]|nr:hypothetical protein [Bacillota bacterium]HZJ90575.1 hypothetical protein [Oscillospiraceae bacterium]
MGARKRDFFWVKLKLKTLTYLYIPVIVLGVLLVSFKVANYWPVVDAELRSNIVTIMGVFSGFQITALSIFAGLPNNAFTSYIHRHNIMNRVYVTIALSIATGILSLVFAVLKIFSTAMLLLFMISITEAVISLVYVYLVIHYSNRSK